MNNFGFRLIGILTTVMGLSIICINIYIENDPSSGQFPNTVTPGSPEEFAIFTPGCKIPKLDPYHSSVLQYIKDYKDKHLKCNSTPMVLATGDQALKINTNHPSYKANTKCYYKNIFRVNEDKTAFSKPHLLDANGTTKMTNDFVTTQCFNELNQSINQDFFAFVLDKPRVEERCRRILERDERNETLSVLLLGLDSVSKNSYIRHMKLVDKLIRKELTFVELHGYNKVGLNTYPNMLPFHTGKMEDEFRFNHRKTDLNQLPMAWKEFERHGYRTLFAEDCSKMASYNYLKRGFGDQPTDYYMRPFSIAVDQSEMKKHLTEGCYHGRTEASVVYKWVVDFFNRFSTDPLFAYVFLTRLSHDNYNTVAYYDKPIYDLLLALRDGGHLNRTVVFFFSDHGYRFGGIRTTYVGHLEDKLPYFFFLLPKWFPKTHPKHYANMKLNERRLTTPFDMHATMMEIVRGLGSVSTPDPSSRSVSLFAPVPLNRTCGVANIQSEFCTCFERKQISVESDSAKTGASLLVGNINRMISGMRNACAELELEQIVEVSAHEVAINRGKKELYTNFLITFVVKPSMAIFQGIALFNHMTDKYTTEKNIDRLNKYGNQSLCINDPQLRLFCYCNIIDDANDEDINIS